MNQAQPEHPYRAARPQLATPPRRVPITVMLPLAIGGPMPLIGWLFIIGGSAACWAMVPHADLRSAWLDSPTPESTTATIESVQPTTMSEDERVIHRVEYRFGGAGALHTGHSFTTDAPAEGANVMVQYPPG